MRALVLSHAYAEPNRRRKLRELAALGWTVTIAIPDGSAGTDGPLRIAAIPARGPADQPDRRRWSRRAIRKLLTDVRPAVVHIEEEPDSPAADAAVREASRLGIPTVLFSWQSLPVERSYLARRRYRRTTAGAAGLIGGNRLAQGLLAGRSDRVPTLSLPQFGVIPPAAVDRARHDQLAIGCVGRLIPERGVDRLLRACGQLMGPWSLAVAGTGPEQESLENLAERLGLAARIRWLGPQTRQQVAGLWQAMDCLVVPSRTTGTWIEVWSPVVLEAMAHGVVPVVSGEGGLPEIVGEAGLVFRDDEELLVLLQGLVTGTERRERLGELARKRVLERFLDAALARGLDGFWRRVVAQYSSGNATVRPSRAER